MMKRPYLVGLKCRELMGKHYAAYREDKLARKCKNCVHNQRITFPGGEVTRVCTAAYSPGSKVMGGRVMPGDSHVGSQGGILRMCVDDGQAASCSIYDPLFKTPEEVASAFRVEVQDAGWKKRNYPDIVALEWVLDNDLHKAMLSPSRLVRALIWVIGLLEGLIVRMGGERSLLSWEKRPKGDGGTDAKA